MRKEHAEHNEKLCDFLLSNGNFNDWVVTTAFYSAIHFVRYKIFPLSKYDPQTNRQETYNNFEHYLNRFSEANKNKKHGELLKLVDEKIPIINGHYRWLFDTCHTSRYKDYRVEKQKAKRAQEYLKHIKNQCLI